MPNPTLLFHNADPLTPVLNLQGWSEGETVTIAQRATPDDVLTDATVPLWAALEALPNATAVIIRDYKPDTAKAKLSETVATTIAPAFQSAVSAVIARKQERARITAEFAAPMQNLDPVKAGEDRTIFRALSLADKLRWIETTDRAGLGALLDAGRSRFPELTDEQFDRVIQRNGAMLHAERTGLQANFATQPTADNPTANGADKAAAEANGLAALTRFMDESSELDRIDHTLSSTVRAVAALLDVQPDDAHAVLTGLAA